MSNVKTGVYKKLSDVRVALNKVQMKRSGYNDFSKYHYFEMGDFLPKALEIMAEKELCGVVSFAEDLAKLTITDVSDGSSIEITSPMGSASLKGCHAVQNIGAVETYQRRYLWMAALEIVEHDILDSTTKTDEPKKELPEGFPDYERTIYAEFVQAATKGSAGVAEAFRLLPNTESKKIFWAKYGNELKALASKASEEYVPQ
jgi:hypothetical protein